MCLGAGCKRHAFSEQEKKRSIKTKERTKRRKENNGEVEGEKKMKVNGTKERPIVNEQR